MKVMVGVLKERGARENVIHIVRRLREALVIVSNTTETFSHTVTIGLGIDTEEIMKYFISIFAITFLVGCAHSSVGGGTYWKNGQETERFNMCMSNCLSKTADGHHCAKFSDSMAKTCKDYLR